MLKESCFYWLVRLAAFPFEWMPYSWIQIIGRRIGTIAFFFLHKYRKRTLSNLALAQELGLSQKEQIRIAKESMQNLVTVCLEYPRLYREKKLSSQIFCENPEIADQLHRQKKGIVFFCAHLSNWEILFLEGTSRMKGIAIGKPIKNMRLYHWILKIREKYGGKIIPQSQCIKAGLRALKQGAFIGIVGDQAMPSSGYSCSFLGRKAWTSTAPALLAYRTHSPLIFAETRRAAGGYRIRYSDPIWPNLERSMEQEIPRMMGEALHLLQASIKKRPGEWLWQHNRWKQQTPRNVYKRFRYDAICLVLPSDEQKLRSIAVHLDTLKEIYPLDFLFLCAPDWSRNCKLIEANETFFYKSIEETRLYDYRFKLVFNFSGYESLRRHYLSLSAFEVITLEDLYALAKPHLKKGPNCLQDHLSEIFKRALCRPGSLWN
ncbi:MAG TPA: hypothetical protein VLE95_04795 [Chlamydiales bacterium]|nr:hypothetical protein [Chlamydiales bacterium]